MTDKSISLQFDWDKIETDLNARGWAVLPELFSVQTCAELISVYDGDPTRFRSKVVMQRHGFGRGEYQYFRYPLPNQISAIREDVYERLVPIANRWARRLGKDWFYPQTHKEYLQSCHQAGQKRPTPLLLKYGPGDYNCLHQDLYGEQLFPLQMAVLLSEPQVDFEGGSLVITEQRPRMQSRPHIIPLTRGDGVIFAVNERPVEGKRGTYRVKLRHGVSEIWRGRRHTLGIIFHDAA